MLKISFAGCLGRSPAISTQFTLEMYVAASNREKTFAKNPYFGLKVVQGHRCWYPRKARQQCLLWCAASLCLSVTVLLLDWTTEAETARFQGSTQIWCTCTYGGSLQSRGSNLTLLKSMFNAKHCIQVVRSISNGFGAIHC